MSVVSVLEGFIISLGGQRLLIAAVFGGVAVCGLGLALGKEFFLTAVVFFGTVLLAVSLFYGKFSDVEHALFFLLYLGFAAVFYGVLLALDARKKTKAKGRKKREKIAREAYYTLPDKENEFLKERLRGELSADAIKRTGKSTDIRCVKTDYVNALARKLKKAPLSAADRLETDRLCELIERYAQKGTLLPDELRAFNDALSAVLKLSAKYVVTDEVLEG